MGYYGERVGMTDCVMCTVGTTQPRAGQTRCLHCSPGSKESDQGSFGASELSVSLLISHETRASFRLVAAEWPCAR